MSDKDPQHLNYYHNKGEQEYWEGEYNTPNDALAGAFNTKTEVEQNIAYGV